MVTKGRRQRERRRRYNHLAEILIKARIFALHSVEKWSAAPNISVALLHNLTRINCWCHMVPWKWSVQRINLLFSCQFTARVDIIVHANKFLFIEINLWFKWFSELVSAFGTRAEKTIFQRRKDSERLDIISFVSPQSKSRQISWTFSDQILIQSTELPSTPSCLFC